MKIKFGLKNVSLVIDQTPLEREKGCYYLRALAENSPLQCYGTPQEISERFGQWLNNTISVMEANNCKAIIMEIKWE